MERERGERGRLTVQLPRELQGRCRSRHDVTWIGRLVLGLGRNDAREMRGSRERERESRVWTSNEWRLWFPFCRTYGESAKLVSGRVTSSSNVRV